jgi:hypothetical protein
MPRPARCPRALPAAAPPSGLPAPCLGAAHGPWTVQNACLRPQIVPAPDNVHPSAPPGAVGTADYRTPSALPLPWPSRPPEPTPPTPGGFLLPRLAPALNHLPFPPLNAVRRLGGQALMDSLAPLPPPVWSLPRWHPAPWLSRLRPGAGPGRTPPLLLNPSRNAAPTPRPSCLSHAPDHWRTRERLQWPFPRGTRAASPQHPPKLTNPRKRVPGAPSARLAPLSLLPALSPPPRVRRAPGRAARFPTLLCLALLTTVPGSPQTAARHPPALHTKYDLTLSGKARGARAGGRAARRSEGRARSEGGRGKEAGGRVHTRG